VSTSPDSTEPAGAYHAVHLPAHPARDVVWRVIAAHLARWVPAHAHVLELGAGYCHWINHVRGARRVAVDTWPEFTAHAAPGVEAVVLDAAAALAAFGERQFDTVLASNLLEHFEPDAAAALVGDIAALLRPGGRVLLVQPNFRYAFREYFDDYTHRSVFTHVSLANLLRSRGLAPDLVCPRFLPYSLRDTRGPVRPWMVRAYLRSPLKPRAGQMLVVAHKD
jgi:SAM-dependent methyltransferase